MTKKQKRTFETVTQYVDLVQAPLHKASDQDPVAESSQGPRPLSKGRQQRSSYSCSRETVLRLINWVKDE